MPLIVLPIPSDHIDDIESILKEKLEEEELTEPLFVKILELFGFWMNKCQQGILWIFLQEDTRFYGRINSP